MRKAVAIPYIIALIIGVVVVAVLAYWFIAISGKGSGAGSEAECAARKAEYCATQTSNAWDTVKEKCDMSKFSAPQCGDFCSRIIPKWRPLPGTEGNCNI